MPQIELERSDLELIRETLTFYEEKVRNGPYYPPPSSASDQEAERLRRRAALEQSAAIRHRITAALKSDGTQKKRR